MERRPEKRLGLYRRRQPHHVPITAGKAARPESNKRIRVAGEHAGQALRGLTHDDDIGQEPPAWRRSSTDRRDDYRGPAPVRFSHDP
ncbi:hypothetical protein [Catenuloplanes japonicus]|uniref:hypothetical protein n=1 Tax=Catenuloplanes japonicus TaxID=33876 RepID=UPI0012FB5D5E|nr:hypothetical protein [Catenuloplanes japonicus]